MAGVAGIRNEVGTIIYVERFQNPTVEVVEAVAVKVFAWVAPLP
jgi:hypothetical protein